MRAFPKILFRSPLQSLKRAYDATDLSFIPFREGLYLSSPEFWQELQKKDSSDRKAREKIERSLDKYWLRSSVRCTPYGTFAGSALAGVSDEATELCLSDNNTHRRSLRLDMNYMAEIVDALVQLPAINEQIRFFTNNSLYPTAHTYRYAEYYIRNNTRNYQLTAVDRTAYLDKILEKAKRGATLQELVAALMETEAITVAEGTGYITELWRSQLLIPALEPSITGPEPLDQVILQLEALKGTEGLLQKLKEIQSLLNNPQQGVDYYRSLEQKLEQLELGIKVPKNTVQADLFLQTKTAHIDSGLIEELVRQAEDLKALARQSSNMELDDFKTRFYARYEEQQVPLALALDADLGIGYAGINDQSTGAGEWIDGLMLQGSHTARNQTPDYLPQFSVTKYHDWLQNGKPHIEIEEADIKNLREQTQNFKFSNSMYLMGSLMKEQDKLDKEHFCFSVTAFGGPSAANLLGRFTHGDPLLCAFTKTLLEQEEQENEDAVYAEIAHLPQARIGNILLRPVLRKYEIPYVGFSGVDEAHQVPLEDLLVSIWNNEVVLHSKKLQKRVIPRLTTAHNFGYNSLPVYKFLCDLQRQSIAYANVWDWGQLAVLKHLPRVVYKNLVLQKATWKIDEKDIAGLPHDAASYKSYFETFCNRLQLPTSVLYTEGDNELLIDFTREKGILLFLHYLRKYKKVQLEEFLFTEENCVVADEQGDPFTNELIIPLYEPVQTKMTAAFMNGGHAAQVQRSFSPYSEWLYFKVYCGAKSAEKILATVVLPFIEDSLREKNFEQFFFIRYRDEDGSHFRIRFYNAVPEKQLPLFRKFMMTLQPCLDNGMLEKVVCDTYRRELERYTPQLMTAAEQLFHNDSLAVLRFIDLLDGISDERYRMLFAMRGIDMLLSDFKLSPEEKASLLKQLQAGFFKEFGAHATLQKQLNDRYRKHQSFFMSHLAPAKDTEHEIEEAVAVFEERSVMNQPVIARILGETTAGTNAPGLLHSLLGSYIHMYVNRLYIAQQRKYELVAYHFLERYYTSKAAMLKKGKREEPEQEKVQALNAPV